MKLNSITIQNFRFFYGETVIEFSIDPAKPITVFVGENGGGKSSIMNALVWCFFNELIPGSDRPDEIRHDSCDIDDAVTVTVKFNHNGNDYEAMRGISRQIGSYFIFKSIDKNGVGKRLSSGEQEIYKIIPKELRSWFFYSGESDLKKVNLSGSKEFKESLSQLQGFTTVRRLIKDLDEAEKTKKRDLDRMGVTDTSKLRSKIDDIERVLLPLLEGRTSIQDEIRDKSATKLTISNTLKELPRSKDLQTQKEKLRAEISRRQTQITERRVEQVALEGNSLPAILLYDFVKKYKDNLQKDPTKNSLILEEPYGKKLFDKIMHDAECICGTKILAGSAHEKKLLVLKEQAKPDTFNNRVAFLESAISEIEGFTESFASKHNTCSEYIEVLQQEIDDSKESIDGIDKDLEKIDEKNYQNLLLQERTLETEIAALRTSFGMKEQKKIDLEANIKAMEEEIERSSSRRNLYSGIKRLLDNIGIVKKYVIEKLQSDEKKSLTIISHELNSLLDKYFYNNYNVRINPETYAVDLINSVEGTNRIEKTSTGEMEVLKYFFITTVLGLASRKTQEKINYLSEPTNAPLVMDAPFTGLSKDYTERVINAFLANLDQLVFLSLPEKFPSYESIIKDKVGKAYVVVKNIQGEQGIKDTPTKFKIFDKEYNFVKYGHKISCSNVVSI